MSRISFQEMAAVIQLTSSYSDINQSVDEILIIRSNRQASLSKRNLIENYMSQNLLKQRLKLLVSKTMLILI